MFCHLGRTKCIDATKIIDMGDTCVLLTINLKDQYHVKETLHSTTSILQVLISSKECAVRR
jgi:hypothetical protein